MPASVVRISGLFGDSRNGSPDGAPSLKDAMSIARPGGTVGYVGVVPAGYAAMDARHATKLLVQLT
jgi:threonine dehydrogenase-like Zn-dependent dehydrogenase